MCVIHSKKGFIHLLILFHIDQFLQYSIQHFRTLDTLSTHEEEEERKEKANGKRLVLYQTHLCAHELNLNHCLLRFLFLLHGHIRIYTHTYIYIYFFSNR